ncbi:hypothetical protein ACJJTC_019191 [Scirpophaga incertulas]
MLALIVKIFVVCSVLCGASHKKESEIVRNKTFKTGEVMHFNCGTSPGNGVVYEIYLFDEMGEWKVETTLNEKLPPEYIGSYEMNFNSTTVEVRCIGVNTTANNMRISTNNIKLQRIAHKKQASSNNNFLWVLATGVLILLIIISLIIYCFAYRTRRTQNKRTQELYENLCEVNLQSEQFPNSRKLEQTYMTTVDAIKTDSGDTLNPYSLPYVEKDLNNLYSKPIPKNQRQAIASHHYASVIPKSQRGKEEISYAELNLGKTKDFQKNIMPEYAAVQKTGLNSIHAADGKYENVFNGKPYVNINNRNNDLVEPNYCEVRKLIK